MLVGCSVRGVLFIGLVSGMQRILFFGLFLFSLVVSGHAWSGVTASPNPSSTGNFTISWTGAEDESVVTETVGGSSEVVNITSGSQYSVSGKATGSYTYSVVTQICCNSDVSSSVQLRLPARKLRFGYRYGHGTTTTQYPRFTFRTFNRKQRQLYRFLGGIVGFG